MHSDQCPYCRKWVCHKPFFGTLHICLPPELRAQIDHANHAVQQQAEFIRRQERVGGTFEEALFGNLFNLHDRRQQKEPARHF